MNKKERNTILAKKNNKETLKVIEEKIEEMEENLMDTQNKVSERTEKIKNMELLGFDKEFKTEYQIIKDKKESDERVIEKWIKPTIELLKEKRIDCLLATKKKELEKMKKEIEEINK